MKEKKRDYFIDIIKAFAIITIMLWHFQIISTKYFIWAIPAFIFATTALYEDKWKEIKIKSIIKKIVWILLLVVFLTIILHFISTNQSNLNLLDYFKNFFYYFFLRNPPLGNLWYFLLYFQILILLFIMSSILGDNDKIKLEKWYFGIISLILSLTFSYLLMISLGQGISFNVISWAFIIWLGLFNYSKIKNYLLKISKTNLFLIFILSIIINLTLLYFSGNSVNLFIEKYTHDFVFPTLIFQLFYFISLFSLSMIIIKLATEKTIYPLRLIGQYSLYIYLFHNYLYKIIFYPILGAFFGFILTSLSCLILGFVLEQIRRRILK
ncbi:Acyltransferase family protein [uncultured archaeon]|nr:Acyltransferase family protein [uncultured archaeon]